MGPNLVDTPLAGPEDTGTWEWGNGRMEEEREVEKNVLGKGFSSLQAVFDLWEEHKANAFGVLF